MNTTTPWKWILGITGGLFAILAIFFTFSATNTLSTQESALVSQSNTILSTNQAHFTHLVEVAHVPVPYTANVQSLFDGMLRGSYDAADVVNALHDYNSNVDTNTVIPILTSALFQYRSSTAELNEAMLDYRKSITSWPTSFFAAFTGYPSARVSGILDVRANTAAPDLQQ